MEMETLELTPDPAGIARAASLLDAGDLVSFPTETVYGLGGDARNGAAVAGIYEAKGRPSFNPLIVHLAQASMARAYVQWSDAADILAGAFWPGPLTLVLPLRENHGLSSLVTAGLDTVALRVPAHATAHRLLAAFGGPVAAPSANPSGRISPTTAEHVLAGLSGKIAAVLNDGPCAVGLESTIIGLGDGQPTLLRSGGLPQEAIEAALGHPLAQPSGGDVTAPGQLSSHYAPAAKVRLNATQAENGELLLGFGKMPCDLNLSTIGDLSEAAANLFDHLHQLDAKSRPIAVAPIPAHGLGQAINDRLRRAAAPR
ncbi:threonylcarbamoyl-AMP synthase [Sulfitobacter sp. M57]|uniref:L-threonylcarbamoyladenylate synthase n=2 Tax=Sulfitobacter TaxID=60136 RepID=UPI0023E09049|nr:MULTISPECIES: L-threonylcarbamoyladenylate synthase [unclassified Sulfitobacter]MDF3415548.1 threonylcarbamoyl-AMP synthase [Sulfitobacter sp. KE5]MDF3423029.1 threonylcarbamoyl-AMP synthase [Sulfitobacter sp. KE43]MDF3434094.1 threonylcarbamoyl-AMP synthase [Sulfitobacter sp. KE42]MDF3459873.1 threonylcarbamoyl-AMP synthase [Sulfitobacter sp. S74]MDF3463633.1 threonylcarbamoyl-AMP synthase [Sulfitobacter sp. Ks18]